MNLDLGVRHSCHFDVSRQPPWPPGEELGGKHCDTHSVDHEGIEGLDVRHLVSRLDGPAAALPGDLGAHAGAEEDMDSDPFEPIEQEGSFF